MVQAVGRLHCRTSVAHAHRTVLFRLLSTDLEPMLVGSLLKFVPVGQTGAFYVTVATTGEVVFGGGDRAKLAFSKSGGTGPFTKMTGPDLKAAGLTHCILGILSNAAGAGSNADSVGDGRRAGGDAHAHLRERL